jgi:diadenosine tetraphosphatase ApaH/serine/threonine PP2A family protein phosphatase
VVEIRAGEAQGAPIAGKKDHGAPPEIVATLILARQPRLPPPADFHSPRSTESSNSFSSASRFIVGLLGTRTVVNPGSLGQPKDGGPEASYAVWQDGAVTHRRVAYPVDRTVAKIRELRLPAGIATALEHLLRTGSPPAA